MAAKKMMPKKATPKAVPKGKPGYKTTATPSRKKVY